MEVKTIAIQLRQALTHYGHRIAIKQKKGTTIRQYRYQQLLEEVLELIEQLRNQGIGNGTSILLLPVNSVEWIIAFLAALISEATIILAPDTKNLSSYLQQFNPTITFASSTQIQQLAKTIKLNWFDLENHKFILQEDIKLNKNLIDGTSIIVPGSNTFPKGIALHADNIEFAVNAAQRTMQLTEQDKIYCQLPYFNCFGLIWGALTPILAGAELQILSNQEKDLIDLLNTNETSVLIGSAYFINKSSKQIQQSHLTFKHLKQVVSYGGLILDDTIQLLKQGQIKLINCYGSTATTSVIAYNYDYNEFLQPFTDVEVTLLNTSATGEGEIAVKGKNVAQNNELINGWLRTGDLGRFIKKNCFAFLGQIDELIILASGEKIYPVELEHLYQGIAGIEELAIIGMPAAVGYGEDIHVLIVKDKLQSLLEAEIIELLHQLIKRKTPQIAVKSFHWVDQLPRDIVGKLQRKIIVQQLLKAESIPKFAAIDKKSNEIQLAVLDSIRAIKKNIITEINPDSILQYDLGLDSLERMELSAIIQRRFGVQLSDENLAVIYTVNDLIQAIVEAQDIHKASIASPTVSDNVLDKSLLKRNVLQKLISESLFKIIKFILKKYMPIICKGQENLPKKGSYIIAANHASHLDSLCLMIAADLPANEFVLMAAKDYYFGKHSFKLKLLKSLLNLIPFDRSLEQVGIKYNLVWCKVCADEQKKLIIFPEATRSITGKMSSFKAGAAIIAYELDLPIVPAYISGTGEALPKGKNWLSKAKITVNFGKCLDMKTYKTDKEISSPYQIYKKITQDLQNYVEQLGKNP